MTEAFLAGTGVYLAPTSLSADRFIEMDREMRICHGQSQDILDSISKIVTGSQINSRPLIAPGWYPPGEGCSDLEGTNVPDIFTPNNFNPPAYLRAKFFYDFAPKMALLAAKKAIKSWGGKPEDISHVITTSTSGWHEPGIAVHLIENLGLSHDTHKIELNFNGCFCGASCMRTARDIVKAGESKAVLVVAVELASTQYNIEDTSMSGLVANALFSDGAGAVIVAPSGGWHYESAGMTTIPNTSQLLTFSPDMEKPATAYKMYLDKNIGRTIAKYFNEEAGKDLLNRLLKKVKKPPVLAIHQGGPDILTRVRFVFTNKFGWKKEDFTYTADALGTMGNLGSAAMLVILDKVLSKTNSDEILCFAFGPGVTVEWSLLKKT
ncbi:hypothetical protein ACFL2K_03215 [Candidatus Margulisiibacteriota bacterium]